MRVSSYNHKVAPFFPHQYKLKKAIEAFSGTKTNTYVAGPSVAVANDKFAGCIVLPNGLIMFVPYSRNLIGLYDPVTNTFKDGPRSSYWKRPLSRWMPSCRNRHRSDVSAAFAHDRAL